MNQKCQVIALLGAANVGKSTLLNQLVGEKIAIISAKPQTTRTQLRGILTEGDTQLVFIDTPGIFDPRKKLDHFMVKQAWHAIEQADLVMLVIDSQKAICKYTEQILKSLTKTKNLIIVMNKVDLMKDKTQLLLLAQNLQGRLPNVQRIFMVSAIKNQAVNDITKYLFGTAPDSEWIYPPDNITDKAERYLAEEITREKIFKYLKQELPYEITISTDSWQEDGQQVEIRQTIFVKKLGQKSIVIGKNGSGIKKIGIDARRDIEQMLAMPVSLFLHAKVKENWDINEKFY